MSIIHKFSGTKDNFSWRNVPDEEFDEEGLKNITKHVVIGKRENAPNFFMRYFNIAPQGHSRLEKHIQEHEIIVLHGTGQVRIADEITDVKPYDVVFIESNELHQFVNPGKKPFGFVCVIPIKN